MVLVLATIYAVRQYKKHKAEKARLETYHSAFANLDLNASDSAVRELTSLQQRAIDADASRAAQGFGGRQYRDCATCGRVNASKCHQRKCHRRQQGGGCCGGKRRARQVEATLAVPRGIEIATVDTQEVGIIDREHGTARESGYHADNKGGFKGNEKEVEAGYDDSYVGKVPAFVELPPYKG
jgi:hypothetical protein